MTTAAARSLRTSALPGGDAARSTQRGRPGDGGEQRRRNGRAARFEDMRGNPTYGVNSRQVAASSLSVRKYSWIEVAGGPAMSPIGRRRWLHASRGGPTSMHSTTCPHAVGRRLGASAAAHSPLAAAPALRRRGHRARDRRPRRQVERRRPAHRARRLPAQQDRGRPAHGLAQRGAGPRQCRGDRAHRQAGRRRPRAPVQRAARGRRHGEGHRRRRTRRRGTATSPTPRSTSPACRCCRSSRSSQVTSKAVCEAGKRPVAAVERPGRRHGPRQEGDPDRGRHRPR